MSIVSIRKAFLSYNISKFYPYIMKNDFRDNYDNNKIIAIEYYNISNNDGINVY
jgi:hypothetical protein